MRGEIAEKIDSEYIFSDEVLALRDLRSLSKPRLYRTLRAWLKNKRGDLRRLELKHIQAIERLAFSRKSGRAVELPGGEKVFKSEGKLQFQKTKVEK